MISDSVLTNLEVLTQEFGSYADSLPSVSSNNSLTYGNNEYDEIEESEQIEQTIEYIPYDGGYNYYNDINQVYDVNTYTMFSAIAIGVVLLAVVALIKVSIKLFKSITK